MHIVNEGNGRACVDRPRLLRLLDRGVRRRLTLVRGPAGSGKTVLLNSWLRHRETLPGPIHWLTLDEGDNDPAQLCARLLHAMDRTELDKCPSVFPAVLTNVLTTAEHPVVLVLDDFHVVTAEPARAVLTELIHHPSSRLHLVVAARHHPEAALRRLRVGDELAEIGAADLAFSESECRELLALREHRLADSDLRLLHRQTRGWVSGLLFSIPEWSGERQRPGSSVSPALCDYLLDEVVAQLPPDDQNFLVQISIVERVSPDLATTMTGSQDCARVLRRLAGEYELLTAEESLDGSGTWFRHNPLLREALSRRLSDRFTPAEVTALHLAAATWFSDHDSPEEAIEHAYASSQPRLVVDELRRNLALLCAGGLTRPTLDVVRTLPDKLVHTNPAAALVAAIAWSLSEPDIDPEPNFARVRGLVRTQEDRSAAELAMGICGLARCLRQGEVAKGLRLAKRICDIPPSLPMTVDENVRAALVLPYVGALHWSGGNVADARQSLELGRAAAEWAGLEFAALHCRVRLLETERVVDGGDYWMTEFESLQAVIATRNWTNHYPLAWMDFHAAWHYWQQHELVAASRHLDRLAAHRAQLSPTEAAEVTMLQAHMLLSKNEPAQAHALLHRISGQKGGAPTTSRARLAALRIRMALARGEQPPELGKQHQTGPSIDLRLVTAHLAAAEGDVNGALDTLDVVLSPDACVSGVQRAAAYLEVAHAHWRAKHVDKAFRALREALELAGPHKYRRIFVDNQGWCEPLLLGYMVERDCHDDFVHDLMVTMRGNARPESRPRGHAISLTARELEILRLLPTPMTFGEIARRMYISQNTVKSHVKNVYRKLRVEGRRSAVRTARDLRLL